MFYNKDVETMSRQKLDELKLNRLKSMVDYCLNNVEFYNKRLTEAKVTGDRIKTLSDIQYIPVTTKEDLRDFYPFGLFAKPMKDIVRIHASSGTTGKATVVGYTQNDLDMWADVVARFCVAAGATEDDMFQISFGYGLFTGALGLHYGLEKIGASIVPASSGNTEKQVTLLKDFGVTGIVSTPSYAMYMSEVAKDMGLKKEDFKLKHGVLGSESCSPSLRASIEEAWGIFVTDNYGMSELIGPGVSGECIHRDGLHIAEDHFLPEIVNSKTLEAMPAGEDGELIITPLTKEAFPLLRYRTKDITSLNFDTCKCGRTHARMEKIKGRSDDMLKIRGVNVFPTQIETVLMEVDEVGAHYQLIVRREGYTDTLEVKAELISSDVLEDYSKLVAVQNEIHRRLKTILGIEAKVSFAEPKELERFVGKAKRIIDLRKED